MLPQTKEQSGVAQRVLQFSAGIKLEKTDPETILNTTNRVLSDDSYKLNAEKISIGFKNSKGAKGAAEKIISICKE
jgi:UDP:flavonoid glycosyltransferase YjiC (YdhE family)